MPFNIALPWQSMGEARANDAGTSAGRRWLVVGLGNPGARYVGTPHNVGFEVVDFLARQWDCRLRRSWRWRALTAKTSCEGATVWLAQPLSFMNNSGNVVRDIARSIGITGEQVIVILDDIALPLEQIRIRVGGGDAGHRGLRSVRESLGDSNFTRVRLGVGLAEPPANLTEYVLTKFPVTTRAQITRMTEAAGAAVCRILEAGVTAAMNAYNAKNFK